MRNSVWQIRQTMTQDYVKLLPLFSMILRDVGEVDNRRFCTTITGDRLQSPFVQETWSAAL